MSAAASHPTAPLGGGTEGVLALALVGTDVHPFDRLVSWIDAWVSADGRGPRWLVQHGTSRPPALAEGTEYLRREELDALVARSALVVCHGGPGTIMQARRHGHTPIVVPRDPAGGEHVDDHQVRFARRLAVFGQIYLAEDADTFEAYVRESLSSPVPPRIVDGSDRSVERFGRLADRLLAEEPRRRWIGGLVPWRGRHVA